MKMSNTFVLLLLALNASVFAAETNNLNWQQRHEMFLAGSFPVHDKHGHLRGEFQINYLPGARNISENAEEHWRHAVQTIGIYLNSQEFWGQEIAGEVTGNLKWGWEISGRHGLRQIPNDLRALAMDMSSVNIREFGAIAHYAKDTLLMGASVMGRPIVSGLIWTSLALKTSIAVPVKLIFPAACATTESAVCGTAVPVLKYIWNGAAWAATQVNSEVPAEQDTVVVTWKKHEGDH